MLGKKQAELLMALRIISDKHLHTSGRLERLLCKFHTRQHTLYLVSGEMVETTAAFSQIDVLDSCFKV